jgi:hypothetical protein
MKRRNYYESKPPIIDYVRRLKVVSIYQRRQPENDKLEEALRQGIIHFASGGTLAVFSKWWALVFGSSIDYSFSMM